MLDIVGNEKSVNEIFSLLRKGLKNFICIGNDGVGKRFLAMKLALILQCRDREQLLNEIREPNSDCNCLMCDNFKKTTQIGNLVELNFKQSRDRRIQRIREVLSDSSIHLSRVWILNDFDKLMDRHQDLFLKKFEENNNDYIFVITSNESRIRPTILSRLRIIRFEKLNLFEIEEVLESRNISLYLTENERFLLRVISDGSVGAILRMLETDVFEKLKNLLSGEEDIFDIKDNFDFDLYFGLIRLIRLLVFKKIYQKFSLKYYFKIKNKLRRIERYLLTMKKKEKYAQDIIFWQIYTTWKMFIRG